MKLVHETDTYEYWADDDKYLFRVHKETNAEEYLDGECACMGCNENRDWKNY